MTDHMTNEALRRAIAELRGVKLIEIDTEWVDILDVGPVEIEVWRDEKGILIPDWPGDPGAALALCLEIQRVLLVAGYALPDLEINQDVENNVIYVSIGNWEGESTAQSTTSEQRLAEAASNVSLAALKAQVVRA